MQENSKVKKRISLTVILLFGVVYSFAQIPDTTRVGGAVILADTTIQTPPGDTVRKVLQKHSPRKAAIRSAILPGLGQIYNKKYWKLPIVYGALGTSAGVFLFNLKWYKRTRFAYKVAFNNDTANFPNVHPQLRPFVENGQTETLSYYRKQYRKDIDFSAMLFILLWGLNVVDATVDAHLKSFDVSPDLSFRVKPGYSDLAGTHGITLALQFK